MKMLRDFIFGFFLAITATVGIVGFTMVAMSTSNYDENIGEASSELSFPQWEYNIGENFVELARQYTSDTVADEVENLVNGQYTHLIPSPYRIVSIISQWAEDISKVI